MREHLHHEYHDPETFREHHAVYTPATIVAQVALTATPGTSILTGAGGTTYIVRTWNISTPSSGKNFTVSIGADAAAKRIWEQYPLTANVAFQPNGWWTITGAGAHDLDANCAATAVSIGAYGYTYA